MDCCCGPSVPAARSQRWRRGDPAGAPSTRGRSLCLIITIVNVIVIAMTATPVGPWLEIKLLGTEHDARDGRWSLVGMWRRRAEAVAGANVARTDTAAEHAATLKHIHDVHEAQHRVVHDEDGPEDDGAFLHAAGGGGHRLAPHHAHLPSTFEEALQYRPNFLSARGRRYGVGPARRPRCYLPPQCCCFGGRSDSSMIERSQATKEDTAVALSFRGGGRPTIPPEQLLLWSMNGTTPIVYDYRPYEVSLARRLESLKAGRHHDALPRLSSADVQVARGPVALAAPLPSPIVNASTAGGGGAGLAVFDRESLIAIYAFQLRRPAPSVHKLTGFSEDGVDPDRPIPLLVAGEPASNLGLNTFDVVRSVIAQLSMFTEKRVVAVFGGMGIGTADLDDDVVDAPGSSVRLKRSRSTVRAGGTVYDHGGPVLEVALVTTGKAAAVVVVDPIQPYHVVDSRISVVTTDIFWSGFRLNESSETGPDSPPMDVGRSSNATTIVTMARTSGDCVPGQPPRDPPTCSPHLVVDAPLKRHLFVPAIAFAASGCARAPAPVNLGPATAGITPMAEDSRGRSLLAPTNLAAIYAIGTLEHEGLGRWYPGDCVDSHADLHYMNEAWGLLAPGATLVITVPVGNDCVRFNGFRVYGRRRLPLLLRGWTVVRVYGLGSEKQAQAVFSRGPCHKEFVVPVFVLQRTVPLNRTANLMRVPGLLGRLTPHSAS